MKGDIWPWNMSTSSPNSLSLAIKTWVGPWLIERCLYSFDFRPPLRIQSLRKGGVWPRNMLASTHFLPHTKKDLRSTLIFLYILQTVPGTPKAPWLTEGCLYNFSFRPPYMIIWTLMIYSLDKGRYLTPKRVGFSFLVRSSNDWRGAVILVYILLGTPGPPKVPQLSKRCLYSFDFRCPMRISALKKGGGWPRNMSASSHHLMSDAVTTWGALSFLFTFFKPVQCPPRYPSCQSAAYSELMDEIAPTW